MYQRLFVAIFAVVFAAFAQQPETGQLDASPTLFTVMAAINAAGYDADLASPNNHPLRNAIRAELAKRDIPSLAGIKQIVAQDHSLNSYVSFALTCDGAPNFALKQRTVDLPPDVAPLARLSPLLAAFYREANIDDLWRRSQNEIDRYIQNYHAPVVDSVLIVNSYLRQQTSGNGRRFQIFIELLAGPNQVQSRSYGFTDTIVVTPSPSPKIFEVRHAYLHYLVDPLATHEAELVNRKKPLIDHALRARALPDAFREDFLQLASECLIKAVESRLDRTPASVGQALKQGYVLTPYFAEQLAVYEKQELAMSEFYRDMIKGIDLTKEDARLANVIYDTAAPVRSVTVTVPAPAGPALTGVAKTLADADAAAYKDHNFDKAKKLYLTAVEQTTEETPRATAYFGLARIAAQQKDPETAESLFKKALELKPDAAVKAWSLFYLGSLAMAAGDRDEAMQHFQDVLKVDGAPDQARRAAQQALQQPIKQ